MCPWRKSHDHNTLAMPKGLQTLGFSFDEPHLTHFGGLVLVQRFCQRLQLRRRLQRSVRLPHRRGDYRPADLLLALLLAIIAGLRRLNKTEILQYNGAFLSLLGLEQFPDQSTLRRGLQRLSPTAIRQVVRLHTTNCGANSLGDPRRPAA